MKSQSTIQQQLRRFAAVLVVIAALTVVALAPALLASQLITQDGGESTATGHIDHAASIDVADIDPDGNVMYKVSPPGGDRGNSDIEFTVSSDFADILRDGDLIKVTVIDKGTDSTSHSFVDREMEEECRITLNLSSDDRSNHRTGTYSGYLRIKDDDTVFATGSDFEHRDNCGLYAIYAD